MLPFGKDVLIPGEASVQVFPKILNSFYLRMLLVIDVEPGDMLLYEW
jgi:hypothetical protein